MPKHNKANDPTGPRRQRASVRTETILRMRAERIPYHEIAKQLGMSVAGVRKAAKRGLAEAAEKIEEAAARCRTLDLLAIDEAQRAIHVVIREGTAAEKIKAIQALALLLKRRAEILGYDAPVTTHSQNHNTHSLAEPFLTREQMAAAVNKGLAEHHAAVSKQQALEGTRTHRGENPGGAAPTTEDKAEALGNAMDAEIVNCPGGRMVNGQFVRGGRRFRRVAGTSAKGYIP